MAKNQAESYARDVVAGKIVAGKLVKLACKNHLRERKRPPRGYYFDEAAGQNALDFFDYLRHSKGKWSGKRFELAPWQQFIVWCLFGWRRKDGHRRYRTAYIEIARKNGKSTLAAGIALYLFVADREMGAEVYSAATKRDQAKIVWREAMKMVQKSPDLASLIEITGKNPKSAHCNLHCPTTGSLFEPLGADLDGMDGLNIHGAIIDELHAHKSRGLWDVIDTATGSREQPLIFAITTAGFNRQSICWEQHDFGMKVLEGRKGFKANLTFFAYIACMDTGDDWENEKNWRKPNPNLDVSCRLGDLREKAVKAKETPTALNAFLQKHLNVWTQQDVKWMPSELWAKCLARPKYLPEELRGHPCYIGLDLSGRIDITAAVAVFPPHGDRLKYRLLCKFWVPAENVPQRAKKDRVPYDVWIKQGFITPTEGNLVDYAVVKRDINEWGNIFAVKECDFDPWNASQIAVELSQDGFTVAEIRQGYRTLSEPTKRFMELVLARGIEHDGNPVLSWMCDNVMCEQDPAGNIKPSKKKSTEKIDGVVAAIMGLSRAMIHVPVPEFSGEIETW